MDGLARCLFQMKTSGLDVCGKFWWLLFLRKKADKLKTFYYNPNCSSYVESESEDSSDDEPLIKKLKKPPTDEELKETVKNLLANANLEEVTMKQICKEVSKYNFSVFV